MKRKRKSFKRILTVVLSVLLLLVNMNLKVNAATTDQLISFAYSNFSNSNMNSLVKLGGNAKITNDGLLRLTENQNNQAGAAFFNKKVSVANDKSFSTYFSFRFGGGTPDPADGIVFVVNNNSSSLGQVGLGIGYKGITNSVAVEFDTWYNGNVDINPLTGQWQNDVSANHIGINIRGSAASVKQVDLTNTGIDLRDASVKYAWIDYNGAQKRMYVYISKSQTRPTNPVITYDIDLSKELNSTDVYAGFTAGTGSANEYHDILSWYFDSKYNPIDTQKSTYGTAPTSVKATASSSSNTAASVISAKVTNADGSNAPDGTNVTFSTDRGTLSSTTAQTTNGIATVTLTGSGTPGNATVKAVADGGAFDTVTITNLMLRIKASDSSKTGKEDTVLPFLAGDFQTLNEDYSQVKITSLPPANQGVLKLNNTVVNINDVLAPADLDHLTFTPAADWNGSTSFKWMAEGNYTGWSNEATETINISPVNDAPSVPGKFKEIPNDAPFKMGDHVQAEFGQSTDVEKDPITYVLDFYDGTNWNRLADLNTTSFDYNLPVGLETILAQFRVKAVDTFGAESVYETSNSFAVDTKAPSLKNITMATSNPDSTKAKAGDTITLNFEADEQLKSAPEVVIAGNEVTPTFGDGKWTAKYTIQDSDADGRIPFTIDYEDLAGNKGPQVTATTGNTTISVDKVKPVIVLNGDASIVIGAGTKYIDEGATASDNIDGDLTQKIDVQNTVNADVPGDYTVKYNVADSSGNKATEVVRNVKVIERIEASDSTKMGQEDTILPVSAADFKILKEDYSHVKITSLPPANQGVLKLNNTVVNINDVFAPADLDHLTFTPAADWNGSTSFKWMAEGIYTGWSNEATETINISPVNDAPSVPGKFKEIPNEVPFKMGDHVQAEFGQSTDVEKDPITYVLDFYDGTNWNRLADLTTTSFDYNLPVGLETILAQFRVKAIDTFGAESVYETSNSFAVDTRAPSLKNITMATSNPDSTKAKAGDTITLNFEADEQLKPAPEVVIAGNKITPTYEDGKWTAKYTIQDSDAEGRIPFTIDYEDLAGNKGPQVTATTGNTTISVDKVKPVITLKGQDSVILEAGTGYQDEGATASDNIDGDLTQKIDVQNTVNPDVPGDYTVKYNVADSSGNKADEVVRQVKVIEKIKAIKVSGKVTEQETGNVIDGAQVSICDLKGTVIKKTTTDADGNYNFTNINLGQYKLVVEKDGYSRKTIEFIAKPNSLIDQSMAINAQLVTFKISFTANPNSIVGDGEKSTDLNVQVLDKNNAPIKGLNVEFSAPNGTFPNGNTAQTDKDGKASTVYKADKIEGTESKVTVVKAIVNDPVRNLHAEQQILVTFEPSSIEGVVLDNDTKQPVNGAEVVVSKDFDGDGVVDFYAKMTTGADGKYKIAIPKGDMDYNVAITKPVKIGNTEVPVTFNQTSKVGTISGAGKENFPSDNTVAGLVLTKVADGSIVPLQNSDHFKIEIFDKDKFDVTNGAVVEGSPQFSSSIDTASSDKGSFQIDGLETGKNYTVAVTYTFDSGEKVVVGTANMEVMEDGQMTISTILIDPYGTITDAKTGKIIDGVDVRLYYADTARNIAAGKTPDTEVNLPLIEGFEPSNNANPQLSDSQGRYAFMVFPNTDYYIKAAKSGYKTYVSPTISVENEIVKHDIVMTSVEPDTHLPSDSGSGHTGSAGNDTNNSHTVDKTKLNKEYTFSGKLVAKDYTAASWNAYQDALKQATFVLQNPNATQAEVDAALKRLKDAKAAIEKAPVETGELALPITATDIYNWILFGTALLIIGIVLFIRQRRRA